MRPRDWLHWHLGAARRMERRVSPARTGGPGAAFGGLLIGLVWHC